MISDGYFSSPGFNINSAVLQAIVSRYADAHYAIDFDSFVGCLIKLEMLFSKCQQTREYHFMSHIDLHDLRAVACLHELSFFSASQPEMFKALERADSGKIELDMQQVRETITRAAALLARLV